RMALPSPWMKKSSLGECECGFCFFLDFLFVHHHFSELTFYIHLRLIFVVFAERISRLSSGQNTDTVFNIGKIDDPSCGWPGTYFVIPCAIVWKGEVVNDLPCSFNGKWPYIEILAKGLHLANRVLMFQSVHFVPSPLA